MAVYSWKTWLTCLLVCLSLITVSTQQVTASNASSDIPPYDSSARYWLNGTSNPSSNNFPPFRLLPLGWYAQSTQQTFLSIQIASRLINVNSANANNFTTNVFNYISCDLEDYPGNLGPDDIFQMVLNFSQNDGIIFYSTRANHCEAGDLHNVNVPNGVFTTLDPVLAASVLASLTNKSAIGIPALLSPDINSFTKAAGSSTTAPTGPTTAVAMIILYTITGLITALFVVIIITGGIRAHRHPDRYGPSNIAGRPRRSRAKGIARAMLDTIPIVKFGESKEEDHKKEVSDIEMASTIASTDTSKGKASETVQAKPVEETASDVVKSSNADGTDEAGHLGCSICTEDFAKGDEVRVLPCNHKYHPDCVDPWLLNVSGTCPLCRIDLRPKEEQSVEPSEGETSDSQSGAVSIPRRESLYDTVIAPPLGHLPLRLDRSRERRERRASNPIRRDTAAFANLRSVVHESREDRIAALRRFRQQRNRVDSQEQQPEEERRGLSSRLRERFRIRTRRAGEEDGAVAEGGTENSTADATDTPSPTAPREGRLSSAGMPRTTWQT